METVSPKKNLGGAVRFAREMPLPAVVTDRAFRPLYCNPSAETLFSSRGEVGAVLSEQGARLGRRGIFLLEREKGTYLALFFPVGKSRTVAVFLENTVPLHLPYLAHLMREGASLLDELAENGLPRTSQALTMERDYAMRVAARSVSLRERMATYYRVIRSLERKKGDAVCVSVPNLLRVLSEKLKENRVAFSFSDQSGGEAVSSFPPDLFLTLVLTLIHFITVYTGRDELNATLLAEGNRFVLRFSFLDGDRVFSALASLLQGEFPREESRISTGILPLFCALALCRQSDFSLEIGEEGEMGEVSLYFDSSAAAPEAFLGTKKRQERDRVEFLVREILF